MSIQALINCCGEDYMPSLFSTCPVCFKAPTTEVKRKVLADMADTLPPFDLEQALAGKPFIHVFDLPKIKPYTQAHRIGGEHPALFVWCGEWLAFDEGDPLIQESLRMLGDRRAF